MKGEGGRKERRGREGGWGEEMREERRRKREIGRGREGEREDKLRQLLCKQQVYVMLNCF